jgi:hypothetical protein
MELNHKTWNKQHAVIRRILMKEKNYRKALPLLLEHHGAVHSAKLGGPWSYQDEVLGGHGLFLVFGCIVLGTVMITALIEKRLPPEA